MQRFGVTFSKPDSEGVVQPGFQTSSARHHRPHSEDSTWRLLRLLFCKEGEEERSSRKRQSHFLLPRTHRMDLRSRFNLALTSSLNNTHSLKKKNNHPSFRNFTSISLMNHTSAGLVGLFQTPVQPVPQMGEKIKLKESTGFS